MSSQQSAQTAFLGGWNLTISAVLFLQGVLCAQFAYYTNVTKRDSVWLKLFVAGLAMLTTLKTIQVLAVMWIQNVTLLHNLEAASSLWATHWVPKLSPIFETVTAIYVQSFFCRRLWTISRNAYIIVACMTSFMIALVSGGVAAFFIFTDISSPKTSIWMFSPLTLGSSDTLKPPFPISVPRQNFLLIITTKRQSAAPAALCALIDFVFVALVHTQPGYTPVSSVSSGSNTLLPQLYVWAAMWTLNSREDIYLADNNQWTLHPELRRTSDSETAGHLVVYEGEGNKPIDLQPGGQDKPIDLAGCNREASVELMAEWCVSSRLMV
ncbi:hypothetical protein B0H19DRAFT_1268480 [Mycena capillaripes]|nr:hypothetical protein B0H19DRAFT_1268480 [Mycena capillaripes]